MSRFSSTPSAPIYTHPCNRPVPDWVACPASLPGESPDILVQASRKKNIASLESLDSGGPRYDSHSARTVRNTVSEEVTLIFVSSRDKRFARYANGVLPSGSLL